MLSLGESLVHRLPAQILSHVKLHQGFARGAVLGAAAPFVLPTPMPNRSLPPRTSVARRALRDFGTQQQQRRHWSFGGPGPRLLSGRAVQPPGRLLPGR